MSWKSRVSSHRSERQTKAGEDMMPVQSLFQSRRTVLMHAMANEDLLMLGLCHPSAFDVLVYLS